MRISLSSFKRGTVGGQKRASRNVSRAAGPDFTDAAAMYSSMTSGAGAKVVTEVVTAAVKDDVVVKASISATDALSSVGGDAAVAAAVAAASSGLDFSDPNVVLAGGAAAAVAALGMIAAVVGGKKGGEDAAGLVDPATIRLYQPRDAVVVFGASGRTGSMLVKSLLAEGRDVIAAVRDSARAKQMLVVEMGLSEGKKGARGGFVIRGGVDVTNPETLTEELFQGATQVVISTGAVFGQKEDGSMGYIDNMTPDRVDAQGTKNIVDAAARFLPKQPARREEVALSFVGPEAIAKWEALNDGIMGGKSSSVVREATPEDGFSGAVFEGELVVEGGGFAGQTTNSAQNDTVGAGFFGFDGIRLRVRSDSGQSLKVVIKTDPITEEDKAKDKEAAESGSGRRRFQAYQAVADTVAGEWRDVVIPWREFVAVEWASNRATEDIAPLDPSKIPIRRIGLLYSKFEYNNQPNPAYTPGPFKVEMEGGIFAFKAARPAIVLISSAHTERNARIGNDEIARMKDVPIVQLNPGGVLNYKYDGECAVRSSGLPYTVIRPMGLTPPTPEDAERPPYYLQALQGDRSSGRMTRDELCKVATVVCNAAEATNKTFELRRDDDADQLLYARAATRPQRLDWMLANLVQDRYRARVGLPPLAPPCPPPPPVTPARREEILNLPEVVATRNNGIRIRNASAPATASSQAPAAPAPAAAAPTPAPAPVAAAPVAAAPVAAAPVSAAPAPEAPAPTGKTVEALDASLWISRWRAARIREAAYGLANDSEGTVLAADGRPSAGAWIAQWRAQVGTTAGSASGSGEMSAQQWIDNWRARNGIKVTKVDAAAKKEETLVSV